MPDDLLLTSYGANEAANYGHKPLVVMSYDEYKASVDREFFRGWERLKGIPLNKEIRNER